MHGYKSRYAAHLAVLAAALLSVSGLGWAAPSDDWAPRETVRGEALLGRLGASIVLVRPKKHYPEHKHG